MKQFLPLSLLALLTIPTQVLCSETEGLTDERTCSEAAQGHSRSASESSDVPVIELRGETDSIVSVDDVHSPLVEVIYEDENGSKWIKGYQGPIDKMPESRLATMISYRDITRESQREQAANSNSVPYSKPWYLDDPRVITIDDSDYCELMQSKAKEWDEELAKMYAITSGWETERSAHWVYDKSGCKEGREICHWAAIEVDMELDSKESCEEPDPRLLRHQVDPNGQSNFKEQFAQVSKHLPYIKRATTIKKLPTPERFDSQALAFETEREYLEAQDLDDETMQCRKAIMTEDLVNLRDKGIDREVLIEQQRQARFDASEKHEEERFRKQQQAKRKAFNKRSEQHRDHFLQWRNGRSRAAINALSPSALGTAHKIARVLGWNS